MLAIDTNLIVRFLVGDHPDQSAKARALISREDVRVSSTVILEAAWALRGAYGYPASEVSEALGSFCGLPRVSLTDPAAVAQALSWTKGGLDFADGLDLAQASNCEAFVTFDRDFARTANLVSEVPVRAP